jgi:hypothetical protein
MARADDKLKELWVGWTRDAINRYVMPDDIEDPEDLIDDMAGVATSYADAMVEEYEHRFAGGAATRKKRPSRRKTTEEDED